MNKEKINAILGLFIILILFVLCSYFVQNNLDLIQKYIGVGIFGIFVYVLMLIVSIVFAPVSVIPLIPLASGLWGWKIAGILNIIGWTIGACIAFILARKYGAPLVDKLFSMKKINDLEKYIPEKHLFLGVVFFRMVTPVDGLSYVLGLFTKMSFTSFTLATIIGITPFAFIFAYAGTLALEYQILFLTLAIFVFLFGIWVAYGNYKKRMRKNK